MLARFWCGPTLLGSFDNAFVPHRMDASSAIEHFMKLHPDATGVPLVIAFTDAPRYLGQVGYTSRVRDWKPRFYYIWDWTIRLVQIGIWDQIRLEIQPTVAIEGFRAFTETHAESRSGLVRAFVSLSRVAAGCSIRACLELNGHEIESSQNAVQGDAEMEIDLEIEQLELWHPIGTGDQPLYDLNIELQDGDGNVLDRRSKRIGFRQVEWKACKGAPADAEPWILHVNGKPLFILGANWVPIRPNFADVQDDQYRKLITAYGDHGFNFLRVWGGAQMEKEIFYQPLR